MATPIEHEHDEHDASPKDQATISTGNSGGSKNTDVKQSNFVKGFRFWAIIVAIAVSNLLTTLEATIVSTALPSIITDLDGAGKYIWVSSGYFLTTTTLQPIYGQLADVFGRRYPMILSVGVYTLGSGICGGASSINMLIAGRVLQGLGAAGLTVLTEMIVCDIVPLRERGTYLGVVMGLNFLGSALGPLFGGLIVEKASWRWVFWLNLPIGGVSIVALSVFLQVKYNKEMTVTDKLRTLDYGGSVIFVGSTISLLIALTWAGTLYAWSSVQVVVPLVLGVVGLGCFLIYEAYFAAVPIMPLHLFKNRTSLAAFVVTLFNSMATIWELYFLPVYFQAVLQANPELSGIDLLPTILAIVPFAILSGTLMSKMGRYKPIHLAGTAIMVVGFGLLTLLHEKSSTAAWVLFQIVESIGAGLVIPTLLPAILAELTDADTGSAAGTFSFLRSFGATWGIAIPSTIFNNQASKLAATQISDPIIASMLTGGQAYEHATRDFVTAITDPTVRGEVIAVFVRSLQRTWQIGIVFVGISFLLVFIEKEIPLREDLDTEYGIEYEKRKTEEAV